MPLPDAVAKTSLDTKAIKTDEGDTTSHNLCWYLSKLDERCVLILDYQEVPTPVVTYQQVLDLGTEELFGKLLDVWKC